MVIQNGFRFAQHLGDHTLGAGVDQRVQLEWVPVKVVDKRRLVPDQLMLGASLADVPGQWKECI